jgi:hypothetical protein
MRPETLEDLEAIRARLVRSQRDEATAIRKLNELSMKRQADKAAFDKLLADAKATRDRALAAYEAWSRAVESYRADAVTRVRERERAPRVDLHPVESYALSRCRLE